MEIVIPYRFKFRTYQKPIDIALDNGIKRAMLVWCRRTGKDKTCLNLTIKQMFQRVGNYYYFFPTYKQARKVIWQGRDKDGMRFLDHFPRELVTKMNETDLRVEMKNGSAFQLIGTDDIDAVMGTNPVGAVFSEFALQNPMAWDYIRPILRENNGWALFNTTPRGKNHAYNLHVMAETNPKWFSQVITANTALNELGERFITDEMIQEERDSGMSEELIQQEFFCNFDIALAGAYYAKLLQEAEEQKRIGYVPWEELLPCFTFWDLGMDDEMSIGIVQQDGFTYKFIDHIHGHGEGFKYYAKKLKEMPYRFEKHFLPHDAKNRELGTGKARSETLSALLPEEVVVLDRPKSKEDKIEASRWILPKCYIDQEKCDYLINSLKSYRQEYDEEKKIWSAQPLHDWAAHGADMFSYFALYVRKHGGLLNTDYTEMLKNDIIQYNDGGELMI